MSKDYEQQKDKQSNDLSFHDEDNAKSLCKNNLNFTTPS